MSGQLINKPIILVNSHRRSGTHFLIDTIRKNIPNAYFPNSFSIPVDFNIGSLFAYSDRVTDTFIKLINQNQDPVIVKSHLLAEETNLMDPTNRHQELIKELFDKSHKLYVYRDGKDVLTSLYHFVHPQRTVSFSEFLRGPNDHIAKKVREPQSFDANRVKYWSYHVHSWLTQPDAFSISYKDLQQNISKTFGDIFTFMNLPSREVYEKPAFPKLKWLHNIQKKLNNYGLVKLPESSSVRPRKGVEGDHSNYFKSPEDIKFFEENCIIEGDEI
ncbi:MAG: sulfotransferase domain-containing protein [Ekhidna sp.]|uniref:sulfotransferase domain-containing protein n=1 Tax=Ekhidna sp. TaxID=2608089 RepID=UPI0032EF41CD